MLNGKLKESRSEIYESEGMHHYNQYTFIGENRASMNDCIDH